MFQFVNSKSAKIEILNATYWILQKHRIHCKNRVDGACERLTYASFLTFIDSQRGRVFKGSLYD